MMLHAKYQGFRPCGGKQEDFLILTKLELHTKSQRWL